MSEEIKFIDLKINDSSDEHRNYLVSHPEFRTMLDSFVSAVLIEKPIDIMKFSASYFNTQSKGESKFGPVPVMIVGPSGVGKGTLINKLLEAFPNVFGFSVSHTTRSPRPGEVNGIHYNFVTIPEMEHAIERGEFIEYAKVHTNYYGTSFKAVDDVSRYFS
jgi:GTPase SAR1 family protein